MQSSESSGGNLRLSTSCSAPSPEPMVVSNHSVLGARSRHCYAIKAIGLEPQIEPWLTTFNRAACLASESERRHENRMDLRRANSPEPLNMTWAGERSEHTRSFQSPEIFFLLTLPFVERAYRTCGVPGTEAVRVMRLIGTLKSVLAHVVGLSEHEHQFQLHKAPMNDGLS